MSNKAANKNQMDELHNLIAGTLKNLINEENNKVDPDSGEKCGNPIPALKEAIKFMKDNGITYLPEANEGVDCLEGLDDAIANVLPFPIRK